MDDATKLQVLKIYYLHWGIEELHARKTIHGIRLTMKLLQDRFQTDEYSMKDGLRRMFYYLCNEDLSFLWSEFVEILLQDHCVEPLDPNDLYDEEEMLFDRKIQLEDTLKITNEDTAELIYENDFTYNHLLSVDAIVALL